MRLLRRLFPIRRTVLAGGVRRYEEWWAADPHEFHAPRPRADRLRLWREDVRRFAMILGDERWGS